MSETIGRRARFSSTVLRSKLLYRVETISDPRELETAIRKAKKVEDVVVVNAQSLTPKGTMMSSPIDQKVVFSDCFFSMVHVR